MNNLRSYKTITILSKKLGGPINLCLTILGTGIVLGNLDRIIKVFTKNRKTSGSAHDLPIFSVHSEYVDNNGADFFDGDQFIVLEEDKNSVLIEIINDSTNPYFVDKDILKEISNYGGILHERI